MVSGVHGLRIFITGIAGFIGSNLADRLISMGHEVSGIDNFLTGRKDNINVDSFAAADIVDREALAVCFERYQPEIVIHCAASYKDPDAWKRDIAINVGGTVNVIEACKDVKKLIYFQTSLCYGAPQEPFIQVGHPINPGTSYAITKTAGERFIVMSGIPFVSFRLANIYGPRNLSGPVPTFYRKIRDQLKCTVVDTRRDFVFIDNLVDIVVQAVEGDQTGIYHISSGGDYSIETMYEAVKAAMKMDGEYELRPRGADDLATLMLSNEDTKKAFKYPAITSLDDGIRKAVEWYDMHEFSETFTHLRGVK
jgi:UDP-glucose 4-epimerase